MGKKALLSISPFCYHIFPAFFHPCCHFKTFAVKHPDTIPALTKASRISISGRQQTTPAASPSSFEQQKKQPHQLLQNFHLLSQHIVKVCLLSDRITSFQDSGSLSVVYCLFQPFQGFFKSSDPAEKRRQSNVIEQIRHCHIQFKENVIQNIHNNRISCLLIKLTVADSRLLRFPEIFIRESHQPEALQWSQSPDSD